MEKIQEHAEFATTLTDWLESTNSWCAEDVSENTQTKLDSTSTDEHPLIMRMADSLSEWVGKSRLSEGAYMLILVKVQKMYY